MPRYWIKPSSRPRSILAVGANGKLIDSAAASGVLDLPLGLRNSFGAELENLGLAAVTEDLPSYRQAIVGTSGLVGYWPLDETSGTTLADLGPNLVSLTLGGLPMINLCTNPSFETDTTNWGTGGNATSQVITRSADRAVDGTYALQWAGTVPINGYGGPAFGSSASSVVPVTAGKYLSLGTQIYAVALPAGGDVNVKVDFYGSTGTNVGGAIYGSNITTTGAWVRHSLTGVVPTGATRAVLRFFANATASAGGTAEVWSDAWVCTESAAVPSYFTGTRGLASDVASPAGGGILFDGVDAHALVTNPTALKLTGAVTTECWHRAPAGLPSSYRRLMGMGKDSGNESYSLWVRTSTGVIYAQRGANSMQGSVALTDATWHHLVFTDDRATARLYVDGVQVASTTSSGWTPPSSGTDAFIIGADGTNVANAWYTPGDIAHAAVYSRALTADEVKAHYERAKIIAA